MSLNVYQDSRAVRCRDVIGQAAHGKCEEHCGGPGSRVCGLQIGGDEFSYFANGIVRYTPTRMPLFELVHRVSLGGCPCDRTFARPAAPAKREGALLKASGPRAPRAGSPRRAS